MDHVLLTAAVHHTSSTECWCKSGVATPTAGDGEKTCSVGDTFSVVMANSLLSTNMGLFTLHAVKDWKTKTIL